MRNVIINDIGALNIEKLDEDLRAAVPPFVGLSQGKTKTAVTLHFEESVTDTELTTAQGILAAHNPAELTTAQTTIANIKTVAQSTEGLLLTDLTAAQVKSLLAVLLWRAGAVEADGTVRPLGQWVR